MVQQERRITVRNKLEKTNVIFEINLPDVIIRNNGKIYDVSYLGMGIITDTLPKIGSLITLDFRLYPEQESIISTAKVVWIDTRNKRFGVEFKTPSDTLATQENKTLLIENISAKNN